MDVLAGLKWLKTPTAPNLPQMAHRIATTHWQDGGTMNDIRCGTDLGERGSE